VFFLLRASGIYRWTDSSTPQLPIGRCLAGSWNEGAHYTGKQVSLNDAEHALAFAEVLPDHIHVLRKRFEEFARTVDGPRWLVIGQLGGRHWPAVVTDREHRIRIISVRRAREEEVAIYEG
jgi:uncharacterized protein